MTPTQDQRLLRVTGFLLAVPVFLHLESGVIQLGAAPARSGEQGAGFDLSIVALWLPLLLVIGLSRKSVRPQLGSIDVLVGLYVAVNMAAFGLVGLGGDTPGASLLRLAQTLYPIAWYFALRRLVPSMQEARPLVSGLLAGAVVGASLALAATAFEGLNDGTGLAWDYFGLKNPRALRFFPSFLSICCLLGASQLISRRPLTPPLLSLAAVLIPGTAVILSYSRASLIPVGMAVLLVTVKLVLDAGRQPVRLLIAAAIAIVAATSISLAAAQATSVSLSRSVGDESAELSNRGHLRRSVETMRVGLARPFGLGYVADVEVERGTARGISQVELTENQFSESAVRAGPLAVGLLVAIVALSLRHAFRTRAPTGWALFGCVTLAMLQIQFTEAYDGPLSWGLVALTVVTAASPASRSDPRIAVPEAMR